MVNFWRLFAMAATAAQTCGYRRLGRQDKIKRFTIPCIGEAAMMSGFEYQLNGGLTKLQLDAPAVHINGYEAAAFAAWSNARLPTEFEWEVAAQGQPISGNFVESGKYHPVARTGANKQMFGDV